MEFTNEAQAILVGELLLEAIDEAHAQGDLDGAAVLENAVSALLIEPDGLALPETCSTAARLLSTADMLEAQPSDAIFESAGMVLRRLADGLQAEGDVVTPFAEFSWGPLPTGTSSGPALHEAPARLAV